MHVYVAEDWKKVLIFFKLERVMDGATSNNLTIVIVCFFIIFDSLLKVNITNKVFCFEANGVIMFQGVNCSTHDQINLALPLSTFIVWCTNVIWLFKFLFFLL
jgi:hypothetical protein